MLSPDKFSPILTSNLGATLLISIIVSTPFIDREFVVLFLLNSFRDVASNQLDNEDFLSV